MTRLRTWFTDLGALRTGLCAMVVALTLIAPFGGGQARYAGLPFVVTVLAPSLFVMFTFVLALDMIMSAVFMSGHAGAGRLRFRRILWVEGVLMVAMLGAWAPLIGKLLRIGQ